MFIPYPLSKKRILHAHLPSSAKPLVQAWKPYTGKVGTSCYCESPVENDCTCPFGLCTPGLQKNTHMMMTPLVPGTQASSLVAALMAWVEMVAGMDKETASV
ncbi:hypothetical protein AA984_21920 [Brevibacillus formosus]|uniref:Uncharacterized protein n=1 Tax=Brevibacillus formosus TaxID=54913 RepID=A0A837KIH4_9BACL|nr:hypothetical protein AA984_21920 [Brevibacillus formosus]MBG9944327.1 hypothetical protein [Brevibacillus formosus]